MILAAVAAGAFVAGLAWVPVVRVAFRSRVPVQMFEGRLFPHPLDDGWEVTPGAAAFGGVRVTRRVFHDFVTRKLECGGVIIATGRRVERYLVAIEKADRDRKMDKALEAIP